MPETEDIQAVERLSEAYRSITDEMAKRIVGQRDVIERLLIARYPKRAKFIRTIGWIERISYAASLATIQSANHFRQWRQNEQRSRELGYR